MVEVVNGSRQSKRIGDPLRAIPSSNTFDKERRELRQQHPRPVVAVSPSVFIELFDSFQLIGVDRYANEVIVFFRFFKRFSAYACRSKWCYTYASIVRHDQFCVRVFTLGCPANDPVVPASLTLVEGYAKLMWFCRLSYPIV